mgnify:CR=1 FL=1
MEAPHFTQLLTGYMYVYEVAMQLGELRFEDLLAKLLNPSCRNTMLLAYAVPG